MEFDTGSQAKSFLRKDFQYSHFEAISGNKVANQYQQKNGRPLRKAKKNRFVTNPPSELMKKQKKFLRFLSRIKTPDWIFFGKKGVTNIDNAKFHKDSSYFLLVDIEKFYPSCKKNDVYKMFATLFRMSPDVAYSLTEFVTLEGGIPTGTPTSQNIALLSYLPMFGSLYRE